MNYSTFEEAVEQGQWPIKIDVLSVYRAFEQIIDGRHKRGVRYRVEEILTLIRLGQIGRDDYSSSYCGVGAPSG